MDAQAELVKGWRSVPATRAIVFSKSALLVAFQKLLGICNDKTLAGGSAWYAIQRESWEALSKVVAGLTVGDGQTISWAKLHGLVTEGGRRSVVPGWEDMPVRIMVRYVVGMAVASTSCPHYLLLVVSVAAVSALPTLLALVWVIGLR